MRISKTKSRRGVELWWALMYWRFMSPHGSAQPPIFYPLCPHPKWAGFVRMWWSFRIIQQQISPLKKAYRRERSCWGEFMFCPQKPRAGEMECGNVPPWLLFMATALSCCLFTWAREYSLPEAWIWLGWISEKQCPNFQTQWSKSKTIPKLSCQVHDLPVVIQMSRQLLLCSNKR